MPESSSHITTSGGLFPIAFVEALRELNTRQPGAEPESFAPPDEGAPWSHPGRTPAALEETIAAAWELLLERWDAVYVDLHQMSVSDVRNRWLLPLFSVLDFDPRYLRGDTVLDDAEELRFPLSHRGWDEDAFGHDGPPPVLHTEAPAQGLDERAAAGRGPKSKSPHDMLQLYLNLSPADQWALLSNGVMLRLLRDYHHTFSKGYVQFDLEAIFETRNYGDFRALYRLCHASRFVAPQAEGDPGDGAESETAVTLSPLERLYRTAQAAGVKVGEDLRGQVRRAIETLGNGFLHSHGGLHSQGGNHSAEPLHVRLQDDAELTQQFYGEILQVIYRILFLLFSEQRGLVPQAGAPLEELYHSQYSITALRERAEGLIPRRDDHTDLWQGLAVTFRMVREGAPKLGVFGYNGMLFEPGNGHLAGGRRGRSNGNSGERLLAGRAVPNGALLQAIRDLTLIERDGVLVRISYADLGVEELGSVYESLLDYTPRVAAAPEEVDGRAIPANTFFLDPRGLERKSTGSYYTHPALVNELIKSALLPVMRDRLARARLPVVDEDDIGEATTGLLTDYAGLSPAQRQAGAEALLALNVCDPAAGSGHFLVKANNALAAELARIRSGDDYPTEAAIGAARRDVLAHCIYAVDVNPMAVELCKVSLWVNASVADRPLSFLDHHIKVGNSLIGATPELLEEGILYDAFALGRAGDDRELAKKFRKQNRQERRDYEDSGLYQQTLRFHALSDARPSYDVLHEVGEYAADRPAKAAERYRHYREMDAVQQQRLLADLWTAAFFWPMPEGTSWAPTFAEFKRLQTEGPEALPPARLAQVQALAEEHCFFHWYLEFPDVFNADGSNGRMGGGFDVILGNPPWERIKLQEKEFFADKAPAIANARTAAQRKKLVKQLPETDPDLHRAYRRALHFSESFSNFLRESGRYPLSAVGDINTYQIFAGHVRQIVGGAGRVGVIVPSGIATDYYNQDYFNAIVQNHELVSLYDFENRQGIFPEVHRSYKFSLLTLTGPQDEEREIAFAFFLHHPDQLNEPERTYTLTPEELLQINPNTGTCPTFRTRTDAELTKKLYAAAPVLIEEGPPERNPWGIKLSTMFHMSGDSDLFRMGGEMQDAGWQLRGNRFLRGDDIYLPLYEAKMIALYDHRSSEVVISEKATIRQGQPRDFTLEEHSSPDRVPLPRYWVTPEASASSLPNDQLRKWLHGFANVTSPTNHRTMITCVLPFSGAGHSMPLILPDSRLSAGNVACFLGSLSSYAFDYVARQKIGGINFTYFILKQLPVIPPDAYTLSLRRFIAPRVLELIYTAWDIKAFADDVWAEAGEPLRAALRAQWTENVEMTGGGHRDAEPPDWLDLYGGQRPPQGFPHPPFMWDEERRAHLRADLDAVYAHLYGLTRDELSYILDTFPIVRRKDQEKHGDYRTKRLILDRFEQRVWE